jgi:hypothetical protein
MTNMVQVNRGPSKASKAEPESAPDNGRKSSDTALARFACAMSLLETVVIKYERLAAGGTHHDLPGNGQEQDNLYL